MTKSQNSNTIKTVLFDLHGTLADTAPDLAYALNHVLKNNNGSPLPYDKILPWVSHGAKVIVQKGFKLNPDHPDIEPLQQQFLEFYRKNVATHTTLFQGMDTVLDWIESRDLKWGIVTNKSGWLTNPLLDALQLTHRAVCVVSGDTLAEKKPHPAPLLYACKQANCPTDRCLYIGDAEKDIQAGKRAGLQTLVALFGYIGKNEDPTQWGADGLLKTAEDLIPWLDQNSTVDI